MVVEVKNGRISVQKGVIVRPSPLQRHLNQSQQIIVLPSSLVLNSKGGEETFLRFAKSLPSQAAGNAKIVIPRKNLSTVRNVIAIKRPAPTIAVDRAASASTNNNNSTVSAQDPESISARKRANLDHMTSEEKLMRRKLKNRVAAQNARDKKRMKMDQMEDKLMALEAENDRILQENSNLSALNKRLQEENKILQQQGVVTTQQQQQLSPPVTNVLSLSPSSAQHDQPLVEQRSFESAEEAGSVFGRGPEAVNPDDAVGGLLDVFVDDDGTGSIFSGVSGGEFDSGVSAVSSGDGEVASATEEAPVVVAQGCQEQLLTDLDSWLESLGAEFQQPKIEVKDEPAEGLNDVRFEDCFGELFPDLTA